VYTLDLRRDVKWSDGKPFTARDVLFTVEVMKNPNTIGYNPMWASIIDRAEYINPFCVRIHYAKQWVPELSKAMLMFKILPRHLFTEPVLRRKDEFCRKPVGTGPFVLRKVTANQQVELVRNDLFWGERPKLSKIVLVYYQDAVTRITHLENGAIQMVTDVEPLVLNRFQKLGEDKFRSVSFHARSVNFLAVNFREKLFAERSTRLALVHSIDRHAILERVFHGGKGGLAHSILTGIYPIGCPLHDDKVKEYPFAPAQAKAVPVDNPEPISLKFKKGDQKTVEACVRMAELMKAAGIETHVEKKIEGDLLREVYDEHDFDMAYWQYDFDETWDACPLLDPDATQTGGSNFMGYRYAPLCELFRELAHEPDPQRWLTIGKAIHRMTHDDLAIVPLWQLDSYLVYSAKLHDVKIHPYYVFAFPERWSIRSPKGP